MTLRSFRRNASGFGFYLSSCHALRRIIAGFLRRFAELVNVFFDLAHDGAKVALGRL